MRWKTQTVVFMGLLAGMSIVLTRAFSFMIGNTIRIGFGDVPIILAGILFGPIAGAMVGTAADLIGTMLNSHGAFFIGFTISSALTGFIPGLFFLKRKGNTSLLKVTLAVVIVNLLVSLTLNTFWLVIMYDRGLMAILPGRIIARLVVTPLSIVFVTLLLRVFTKNQPDQSIQTKF